MIRVALGGFSSSSARLVRALLDETPSWDFEVAELDETEPDEALATWQRSFDALLLRSTGPFAGAARLRRATVGSRPVIVLTDRLETTDLPQLAEAGVHGVLAAEEWTSVALAPAVAFAVARATQLRTVRADPLTDLATRQVLDERLTHHLSRRPHEPGRHALLLVDVDNLKQVNEAYGHDGGDRLLREVAARLLESADSADVVARIGGDEFAVLAPVADASDAESGAMDLARRVIAAVGRPIMMGLSQVPVGISVGAALSRESTTPEMLLGAADAALFEAKHAGKGRAKLFTRALDEHLVSRLVLEEALAEAVNERRFWVAYQPIVDVGTAHVAGVEALLRWDGPDGKAVSPAVFVPMLERMGLLHAVDAWVFEQSMTDLAAWRSQGVDVTMHVNVSAADLADQRLALNILQAAERHGVPMSRVAIELTEQLLFQYTDTVRRQLGRLRWEGARVALDDFGTGYNSLPYLREMSVDILKIDRSYVANVARRPVDAAIVSAILLLAAQLGMEIVAEGVEEAGELQALASLGTVHQVQGYLYSKPVDAEAAFELCRAGTLGTAPSAP